MEGKQKEYKAHVEELMGRVQPMTGYRDTFVSHCKDFGKRISTGILGLDRALNGGLANELYIMGAETSTGKSAFMMSIAQKVAEAGTDVLYFALEMGRDEFVARGVSAISYEHSREDESVKPLTAANILYWTYSETLRDFAKIPYSRYGDFANEYFDRYGAHLHIVEGGTAGLTAKDIANVSALFKKRSKGPVAVFVDYLQIIKADPEDRTQADRKTKTDVTVITLKTLASQVGMPVFVASSVGRAAYSSKVSLASYKESGDTEFTGGVMLGWNWHGVTDEPDDIKRSAEKAECRDRGYRDMHLDVLKYRNSERDSTLHLRYYPAYNFFEEDTGGRISTGAGRKKDRVVVKA